MRALIPREGAAPVRDRLLMTVFIAALLHGMIIMGLTFGGSRQHGSAPAGIDVLLVSDELPTAARNDTAAYLAQRTQLGSGNARRPGVTHDRTPVPLPPPQAGSERGSLAGSTSSAAAAAAGAGEPLLTTTATRADIRYFTAAEGSGAAQQAQALSSSAPSALTAQPDSDMGDVQLLGPRRDELWIAPDSRASIVAPYLDSWRRRVERIGTLNYPTAARHAGVSASPVLEVAIAADGRLQSAQVRRSSGYPDLDQAALEILKLASPFEPFPPDLAARYRSLHFAYEWQFTGGHLAAGTLTRIP